jgi:hypothetical protein
MPKINQLSKEAVERGIFNYLVYRDPGIRNTRIEIILGNNTWRKVNNLDLRRQNDIEKLLGIISNVNSSHEVLHIDIWDYLEKMGKGIFGGSKLRDFIQYELAKINALALDRGNLNFLQSIVDKDPEGKIAALVSRINQLERELQSADEVHRNDQYQIKFLQAQILGLQMSMRHHQEELSQALEVIKKNQAMEKEQELRIKALENSNLESSASINQLLFLLQSKGLLSDEDMKYSHPTQSSAQFKRQYSLPQSLPEKTGDVDEAHSMDSTKSFMSLSL